MPPVSINYTKIGDVVLGGLDKSNCEVLALMYGSLVAQVLRDAEDLDAANAELERLGCETGYCLIEEFLAKTQLNGCSDFRETCEVLAKVAFKVFLGVAGDITYTKENANVCWITLPFNPLSEFVDLPPPLLGLNYNGYTCGVIKGALERVQLKVQVSVTKDVLLSGDTNEFKIELLELLKEAFVDIEDL